MYIVLLYLRGPTRRLAMPTELPSLIACSFALLYVLKCFVFLLAPDNYIHKINVNCNRVKTPSHIIENPSTQA